MSGRLLVACTGSLAALALSFALALGTSPPAAAEADVTFTVTTGAPTVRLGEDIILNVRVSNGGSEPLEVPALRLATDSVSVRVTGEGVRDSLVTRAYGQFRDLQGELEFETTATRRASVPPGGRLTASIRFPAVALGELSFRTALACTDGPALQADAVVVDVVPQGSSRRLLARVETSRETSFTIELDGAAAFNSVTHFWSLARDGFYNDLPIHRVVPDALVQSGDPRGDGTGTAGWYLPVEVAAEPFTRGTVGLARGGHPDSGGSQWFVALGADEDSAIPAAFARLGRVLEGLEVVDALATVELIDGTHRPRQADRIRRIRTTVR